jgi:hypothetical protein
MTKCKLHPNYKAKLPPRSHKAGCVCRKIWNRRKANPKDLIGVKKVQLGLFPAAGLIYGAVAMEYGAGTYTAYNWRDGKVKTSVYLDALERHLIAFRDGEDVDPDSGLSHIAHAISNCAILADAIEGGFLIDDRPAKGPAAKVLEKFRKK